MGSRGAAARSSPAGVWPGSAFVLTLSSAPMGWDNQESPYGPNRPFAAERTPDTGRSICATTPAPNVPAGMPADHPLRALVVDDDPGYRVLLQAVLKRRNPGCEFGHGWLFANAMESSDVDRVLERPDSILASLGQNGE